MKASELLNRYKSIQNAYMNFKSFDIKFWNPDDKSSGEGMYTKSDLEPELFVRILI